MSQDAHASDPVGSLAEEAAKFVRAVTAAADPRPGADRRHGTTDACGHDQGGREHDVSNCAYCPICLVIGFVRESSPETIEHLADSAASLTAAARSVIDAFAAPARQPTTRRDPGVQNIDLSDSPSDDTGADDTAADGAPPGGPKRGDGAWD